MSKTHVSVYRAREENQPSRKFNFMKIGQRIKVALIFPQELYLQGICNIFSENPRIDVIKSHRSFEESIVFWEKQDCIQWPDVILISDELHERKKDNLQVIEQFKALRPQLKMIMMSQFENDDFTSWFLAGIKGYLLSCASVEELEIAITAVNNDCYCVRLSTIPLQVYKEIRSK